MIRRRKKRKKDAGQGDPIENYRRQGVTIGNGCSIYGVHFDRNFPFLIKVGDNCIITRGTTILAHDAAPAIQTGKVRVGPVVIEDDVFIGQNSTILPGVTVGRGAIVGAASVVSRDVGPGTVVAGAPARVVAEVEEYVQRVRDTPTSRVVDYPNIPMDAPDAKRRRAAGLEEVQAKVRGLFPQATD